MMKALNWITKDTTFNFMKLRKLTNALSIAAVILSIACIAIKGFNYGIDFSGGILIEIKSEQKINVEELRTKLSTLELDEVNIQSIGEIGDEVMIRTLAKNMNEKEQMNTVNQIKNLLKDEQFEFRRVELVGPQVGDELKKDGIVASVIAVLALSLYIWVRFEWQFAIGTLVGLVHDLIITCGLLSLFGMDFTLTTMASILALAGYTINDKVVTYDRIRENLRKFKKMPQIDLFNKSLNDILSRTLLTGITTLFASGALLIFGGDSLRSFAFVITFGIIIGTYSSLYIGTSFLNLFDMKDAFEEKKVNPFGHVDS